MILTIDNLDGLGPQDYSGCVLRDGARQPLTLHRVLNAPATLKGTLCLAGAGVGAGSGASSALPMPRRRARAVMTSDTGVELFTGYLTLEPEQVYAGMASTGPVDRLGFTAVSDEWVLDQATGTSAGTGSFNQTSGAILRGLAKQEGSGIFVTSGVTDGRSAGIYVPAPGSAWHAQAGAAAAAGYTAYRALGGTLTLSALPGAVHTMSDQDGSLTPGNLQVRETRELANDITLTGELEPAAFWTELFRGDGITSSFALTGDPAALAQDHAVLLTEDFSGATLNRALWTASDPGSRLALGADGLLLNGGNGFDGQTTLTARAALELGGSVVLELGGLHLGAGSAGVVCGLYSGAVQQANCLAGFNVRQSGGQTLLIPLLNGVETGGSLVMLDGHRYTLRLRLFCAERLRMGQTFYTRVEGAVQAFGGALLDAPLRLVLEARDQGLSSNTPVTVLYDGALAASPAQASLVAVNSVQLFGALGSVTVKRMGCTLVEGTDAATGAVRTSPAGQSGEGVDCAVTPGGTAAVTFFPGRLPEAGELVTVQYRSYARAVARLADEASVAAEAAFCGSGVSRYVGRLTSPAARSSEDCEQAAAAVLAVATNREAALSGTCVSEAAAMSDWLPGDLLTATSGGASASLLVREVTVEEYGAVPETLHYRLKLANDWAEPLGLHLSETPAADANLPAAALALASGAVPVHVLANLRQMTVTALTSQVLTLDAGLAAPAGGGFEVRRRDGGWGSGSTGTNSGDLVLRSPVRGFDVPRAAFEERFFVRMYDGGSPANYSRWSAAVVTHAAVS